MAAESFFARWSRRKAEATGEGQPLEIEQPAPSAADAARPDAVPPGAERPADLTLDDVAKLTPDANFSQFMTKGVAQDVRRAALKKLFTDPHYNVMDGLDIYIDDYNKFEPLTPAMLASLNHAKSVLNPVALYEKTAAIPEPAELAEPPARAEPPTGAEPPADAEQLAVSEDRDPPGDGAAPSAATEQENEAVHAARADVAGPADAAADAATDEAAEPTSPPTGPT